MSPARAPAGHAILAALLLFSVAACDSARGSREPDTSLVDVPTQEPQPSGTPRACMAALIEGVLVADDRWGIALRDQASGSVRQVIWPNGFAARPEGDRLALLDATGRIVAYVGDRVRIGGGEISSDGPWLACADTIVVQE